MRYNRYGDDFLIDKIQPGDLSKDLLSVGELAADDEWQIINDLSKELLSVGELAADDEWQIINDNEHYPQKDCSTLERETDLEQSEIERRENTNLRI